MENLTNKNPPNDRGDTPLHEAVFEGNLAHGRKKKDYTKICKLIIENITNKHPRNNNGKTPKALAWEYEDEEILKIVNV